MTLNDVAAAIQAEADAEAAVWEAQGADTRARVALLAAQAALNKAATARCDTIKAYFKQVRDAAMEAVGR